MYYDLDKYILKNGKVLNKFIDIVKTNIHLLWEPLINYHIQKLKGCCNISKKNLVNLKNAQNKYFSLKRKLIMKTNTIKNKKTINKSK